MAFSNCNAYTLFKHGITEKNCTTEDIKPKRFKLDLLLAVINLMEVKIRDKPKACLYIQTF